MQVHDELVIEAKALDAQSVADALEHSMNHACELSVPLLVDIAISDRWE